MKANKNKPENLLKGKKDNSFRKGIPTKLKAKRQEEAQARQEMHSSLTTEQKIEKVISRIGPDKDCKELDRLRLQQLKEARSATDAKLKKKEKGEAA